jgi:hypothetical protein
MGKAFYPFTNALLTPAEPGRAAKGMVAIRVSFLPDEKAEREADPTVQALPTARVALEGSHIWVDTIQSISRSPLLSLWYVSACRRRDGSAR